MSVQTSLLSPPTELIATKRSKDGCATFGARHVTKEIASSHQPGDSIQLRLGGISNPKKGHVGKWDILGP